MPESSPNPDSVIDPDMKESGIQEEQHLSDKDMHEGTVPKDDPYGCGDEDATEKRIFPRSEFAYPVEFKLFHQHSDQAPFRGVLKNISISGACLQFEDRYGRVNIKDIINGKIKINFSLPQGEKVSILALIIQARKADSRSFKLKIGIEFQDPEPWQIEIIEQLIGMRNKDHNMMWNLWEQYESNWR